MTTWPSSLVRIGLGLLLCAAALGKSLWPDVGILLLGQRHGMWLPATLCALEIALGAWLISGIWPTWSCRAALVVFFVFSVWSFHAAMAGEACACFGAVLPALPANAWLSFAIDLACIGFLVLCANDLLFAASASRAATASRALMLPSTLILCLGALTTHAMWSNQSTQLLAADQPLPYRSTILLDPARWIGAKCPLLAHIDIGAELADGDWTMVLVDSRCARCDATIANMTDRSLAQPDSSEGSAFIDVHDAREPLLSSRQFKWGRLLPAHRWLVRVPVKIHLRSGVVVGVSPPG
jgi:hypothetical protein